MTCATCVHFLARGVAVAKSGPFERRSEPDVGICRRLPPRVVYDHSSDDVLSVFPAVHRDHECGEMTALVGGELR